MVTQIARFEYIVTDSELEALVLENNLIKKYKPRYNVLLKDDKTYPSICVQNEYFPRIFRTRKIIKTVLLIMAPTATFLPCMRCST